MFADDIVLLAESMERMTTLFDAVSSFCSANALHISSDKTKLMLCGSLKGTIPTGQRVCLGAFAFEVVDSFKYLGLTFDHIASPKRMVECLTAKGEKVFHWLRKFVS